MFAVLTLTACFGGIATDTGEEGGGSETGSDAGTTDGGLYALSLTSDPARPVTGKFTLHLGLTEASGGAAVEGATLTLVPYMPEMGHGISGDPDVTETGGGGYDAKWVWPMAGEWEVTTTVEAAAGTDTYKAVFEVE